MISVEHSVSGPNGRLQGPHGLLGHVQGQLVPWSRDVGSQAHPSPGREACLEGGWTQLVHTTQAWGSQALFWGP